MRPGHILTRFPASKVLGVNVVLWGIATASTAAAKDYHSLLTSRIFLGIFEACVVPTLVLISSRWYTKSEQAPRFAFWYCGLGAGQIIGGILSFGFQHVIASRFESWRIMFVVLGGVTVLLGVATFFWLPDDPSTARFLSGTEKEAILQHVAPCATETSNIKLDYRQLWIAVKDPQLPLLALMTILVRVCASAVSAIVLTFLSAEHLFRRRNLLLSYTDQELWILAESHRTTQHTFWCGVNRKYPHRGFRCPPYLTPLVVVHRIMHSGDDRRCTDELFASDGPSWTAHRRLPGEFHRADRHADVSIGGCEHVEPHRARIRRHRHGLLVRCGQHHRASDFSSRGCADVSASEDHRHGDSICVHCLSCDTLRLLPMVEQTPCKWVRILDNPDIDGTYASLTHYRTILTFLITPPRSELLELRISSKYVQDARYLILGRHTLADTQKLPNLCLNRVACESRSCATAGRLTDALSTGPTPHPPLGVPAPRLSPLSISRPIHAQ